MNERKGEIRALTGLRGIAALNVATGHLINYIMDKHPALKPFLDNGKFDVQLFFCLSALTLCLAYGVGTQKRLDLRKYFTARFARVYPVAILALLVAGHYFSMWSHFSDPSGREEVFSSLRELLLINHWPIIGTGHSWIGPLWTLSVEVFLYIFIFPFLFVFGKGACRLSANKLLTGMVAIMVFRLIAHGLSSDEKQVELCYWLLEGIIVFVSGWLMYLLYSSHRDTWTSFAKATDFMYFFIIAILASRTIGLMFGIQKLEIMGGISDVMECSIPFLVGGALLAGSSYSSRFLSSKPVHFLGQISYSLYVWHMVIHNNVEDFYNDVLHREKDVPFFLVTMAASLLVATLSYFYFECPARNFIRRRFLGRREERAATSS